MKYFELSSNFISAQDTGRYPPYFPTQTTHDPSYTSSPNSPTQNQDYCSDKDIQILTPKEPLYCVPNSYLDQLHHCTQP